MKSNSFSPANRLHYSWEYRRFFKQGRVFRLPECTIFQIKNDLGHYRLGMTVKARCGSVQRNRVKRVTREFFRLNSDLLGSFDYNVVIPGSRELAHPFPERLNLCLEKEFKVALRR